MAKRNRGRRYVRDGITACRHKHDSLYLMWKCWIYFSSGSNPRLTRNTWPSGWRRCISRTFHGILVGGNVISSPAVRQCLCISSTSSTQTDIQTPLSALFVSIVLERGGVHAAAAASLRSLTKKDASLLARSDCAKRGRSSPVPQFLPSPLFKPHDCSCDVGHIQYRS